MTNPSLNYVYFFIKEIPQMSKIFCLELSSKILFQLYNTLLITTCDNTVVHIYIDTSLGRMMIAQRLISIISYHYAIEEFDNIFGTILTISTHFAELNYHYAPEDVVTSYHFHKILYIQKSLIYPWNCSNYTNPRCKAQLTLCIRRCCH